MIFLVDSNVISESTKPAPNQNVIDWPGRHENEIVVDSIVLGELLRGILALPQGRKRQTLAHWFETVALDLDCIPWDSRTALRWARLAEELRSKGQPVPVLDSMIAATALTYGFTVATRNIDDFQKTGVKVVNPFEAGGEPPRRR